VGVALVVAEVAVLVMVGGRKSLVRASAFAAATLAPLAVWLVAAGRGNRPVVVHLFDAGYWTDGVRSLSRWVLPPFAPWPVRGVATAVVAAGLAWVAFTRRGPGITPDGGPRLPSNHVLGRLLAAFTVAYLAVLVVDRVFFDATGRLDLRFLAVPHVVALVGLLPWLHRTLAGRARTVAAAAGLLLVGLHGWQAATWVADGLTDTGVGRRGLTAGAWRESPVLAAVAALPSNTPVFSNAPEAVFLLTGRTTLPLPAHTDYLSGRRRPGYPGELAAVDERLAADDGVVVWFGPYAFRQRFLAPVSALDVEPVLDDEVATLSRSNR
jgi:hypothetical protein